MIYRVLDLFFLVFHLALVLFNLSGYLWRRTRVANLVTLGLTGASWFLLGVFYGWGYCPLTDWHWKVLHHLGKHDLPGSYIQYLVYRLSGLLPEEKLTETLTLAFYLLAAGLSVYFNFFRKRRTGRSSR